MNQARVGDNMQEVLGRLMRRHGMASGTRVEVAVTGYRKLLASHYGIEAHRVNTFAELGLRIHLPQPTEFHICDENWRLDPDVRLLVAGYGAVSFSGVLLGEAARREGQRNIFPHLAFHLDRGPGFENQYSMFFRDALDEIHHAPRKSSTLVIPRLTAQLQAEKEGKSLNETTMRIDLFHGEPLDELLDKVILEQAWRAPAGVGELCVVDNRTVFHASYHHTRGERGYPIGVRYLY